MKEEDRNIVIAKLKELLDTDDIEMQHYKADVLLCEILVKLGEFEIVEIYKEIPKYYV